ncbi:hypothetical protein CO731_01678 [Aminobacter sp. MSH1]|uniref:hypothetical protein n=1 Tax=Aminobacter sp. MSH1 TaxID=374606 RepID=UPI000D504F72|nr:hypothetical protein [Aminobacter sp. MSH1]AWC22222.1 hypothetical protein CO731_01678 [Aminobacter sp. MSH1]
MAAADAQRAQPSGDNEDRPKRTKVNRRSSERYRAPQLFAEKWTNAKAGLIGFMTGQGRTSTDIVEHLNDGTDSATVRALWKKWGLPIDKTGGRRRGHVPVSLTVQQRMILTKRAKGVGIQPEEYLRRIASCAIEDDLYAAVTDGKFDPKLSTAREVLVL